MKRVLLLLPLLFVLLSCETQPSVLTVSTASIKPVQLKPGDTAHVTCDTSMSVSVIDAHALDVACAVGSSTPAPTSTTVPTFVPPTAIASATLTVTSTLAATA